jgi:hypothetical protein
MSKISSKGDMVLLAAVPPSWIPFTSNNERALAFHRIEIKLRHNPLLHISVLSLILARFLN